MVWAGTWRVGGVLAVSRAFGGSFSAMAEAHDLTIYIMQTHFVTALQVASKRQIVGHMRNTCKADVPMLTMC